MKGVRYHPQRLLANSDLIAESIYVPRALYLLLCINVHCRPSTMSLSKHVKAESVLQKARDHPSKKPTQSTSSPSRGGGSGDPYASRYETQSIPKHHLPSYGVDADAALQLIRDEVSSRYDRDAYAEPNAL